MSSTQSSAAPDSPYANYSPVDPPVRADPYPYYRWLQTHAPVKFVPAMKAYGVSRYEDVRTVRLDRGRFSSDPLIQIAFSK